MPQYVNDNGTVKETTEMYVNDQGTVKFVKEAWVNDQGVVKKYFVPKGENLVMVSGTRANTGELTITGFDSNLSSVSYGTMTPNTVNGIQLTEFYLIGLLGSSTLPTLSVLLFDPSLPADFWKSITISGPDVADVTVLSSSADHFFFDGSTGWTIDFIDIPADKFTDAASYDITFVV